MKKEGKFLTGCFYLLFFLSGAAGLVYQAVWLRMFTLVLGNSLHSASIVFASFMCGLALGAWFFGRYIKGKRDILAVYALLELGIAVTALAVGKALPHASSCMPDFQRWLFHSPLLYNLFRVLASFLILLPPTALIGGTLPVLTHFLSHSLEAAGKRIGGLYGWNTVGAVIGCAITGFWLLRVFGMSAALYSAATINLFVALAAVVLRYFSQHIPEPASQQPGPTSQKASGIALSAGMKSLLLLTAGITGAASLAYEVVWARFLSYILLNDIYAFYLMLSTILFGIGAGSLLYSRWLSGLRDRLRLLGFFEIGLGLTVGACYLSCAFLYLWEGSALLHLSLQNFFAGLFSNPFYSTLSIRLIYTLAAMFLPSVIMGIVFPLICSLYLADKASIGSHTGLVYAVNTTGAIIGSLAAGFFLVPSLGVQASLFLMAAVNLILGSTVLFFDLRWKRRTAGREFVTIGAAVLTFCLLCFIPANQVREFALKDKKYARLLYYGEGLSGTVAVLQDRINGIKTLYINAVGEVENSFTGMQTFKVLGHLPLLLHAGEPQRVLMVTFGAGIASGAVTCHPIAELDVVELEPAVVEASGTYREENYRVVDDPRIRVHIEDGRNYLATTNKLYDVIISDATNPASSDSWLLYTLEFYNLCREKLSGRGIMAQWLPLHSGSPDSYCTIVKTFQQVFPHTSIWFIKDYTMLVGLPEPLGISYPGLVKKLSAEPVRNDLAPYCLAEPLDLLDCFLMGELSVREMVKSAQTSTDNLPFYQLKAHELTETREILSMLEIHRERVFPMLSGLEGPEARAVRDSLELYFQSQGYLLQRNYLRAARSGQFSCKYRKYYQEYQNELQYLIALSEYDPGNYPIQMRVGLTLVEYEEYSKAREVFTRMASLNPKDPSVYHSLGNIDFKMGAYDNAARNYRKALELGIDNQDLMINLGLALFGADSLEEGIEFLEQAVQLDSTNTDALFYLGLGYHRLEKSDQAADCYERVIQQTSDNLEALINLGLVYLEQGKLSQSEKLFKRAVSLQPRSYFAWVGLGKALFRMARYAESRNAFQNALAINPQDEPVRKLLAEIESYLENK